MKKILMLSVIAGLWVSAPAWAQRGGPQGPQPVFVTTAQEREMADRVEALGTLRANETITLTSTVSDTVTAVNFDDGQRVEAGDILVEMTSDEEKALLEEAQADVEEAARQVERLKPLIKKGAAAKSLLDERERDLATASARLQATKSRLKDLVITAPFSGVLGLRNISPGALIQPGTQITTLDDDSVMKLDFSVPSLFLSSLKIGLPIEAKAKAFPGEIFKGTISSIDTQINPATRAVTVRAILPNDDKLLRPGLLMSVELFKNQRRAIVVPEEAVVAEAAETFVFVVRDKDGQATAYKQVVETGVREPGNIEITDGLNAGDKIVVHGVMRLTDETPVEIKAEEKEGDETLQEFLQQ